MFLFKSQNETIAETAIATPDRANLIKAGVFFLYFVVVKGTASFLSSDAK
jgi:hypothetical protein